MGRVRYSDFRQAVRRHAPSELIPYLSVRAAAKQPLAMGWDDEWARGYPPWVYAAIAREAILYGNEHRRTPVDEEAFRQLRNLMTESHDAHSDRDENPLALLGGYAYEQFPYQTSIMEERSPGPTCSWPIERVCNPHRTGSDSSEEPSTRRWVHPPSFTLA